MSFSTILISSIVFLIGYSPTAARQHNCTPHNGIIDITLKCSDRLVVKNARVQVAFTQSHRIYKGEEPNMKNIFNPGVKATLTGDILLQRRKENQNVTYNSINYFFDLHGYGDEHGLRLILTADNMEQDGFEFPTEIKHFLRKEMTSCLEIALHSAKVLEKNPRNPPGKSCPAPEVQLKRQRSYFSFQALVNKFTEMAIRRNLRESGLDRSLRVPSSVEIPWFDSTTIHGKNAVITGLSSAKRSGDVIVSRRKKNYSFLLKLEFAPISVSLKDVTLKRDSKDIYTTSEATVKFDSKVHIEAIVRFKRNEYPCKMIIHKFRIIPTGNLVVSDAKGNSQIPRQNANENITVIKGISDLLNGTIQSGLNNINCANLQVLNFF